jgi:leucyl-tRNA synthetase
MTGDRVWEQPWPEADPALVATDTIQLVVQLNGKVIDRLDAPAEASNEELEELARGSDKLASRLNGQEIDKAIVVPGKLVNFVVR